MGKQASGGITVICRKAWPSYLRLFIGSLFWLAVSYFIYSYNASVGLILFALVMAITVFKFFQLRSVRLYVDDVGVWEAKGIVPWKRSQRGVKWRDLDEASYSQNFWGWVFKTHNIVIRHRYTKDFEVVLVGMYCGDKAVGRINSMHLQLLEDGRIL